MKRIIAAVSAIILASSAAFAQSADPSRNRGPGTSGAGIAPNNQPPSEDDDDGVAVPFWIILPAALITAGVIVAATNGGSSTSTPSTRD